MSYRNKRTKHLKYRHEKERHAQSLLVQPIAPGKEKHHDSYVVVKKTGATKTLTAKTVREPLPFDQSLGYVKKRKYHVWTNNPKTEYTGPRVRSTALTVRLNDYYTEQITLSKKLSKTEE